MLKSSKTIGNAQQPPTTRGLRKAHSIESLETPKPSKKSIEYDNLYHKTAGRATVDPVSDDGSARPETRSRGRSIDVARPKSRARNKSSDEGGKGKDKKFGNSWTPSRICTILDTTPSATLELETVKKLRLHLRNESAWYISFPLCSHFPTTNLSVTAGPKNSSGMAAMTLSSTVWTNCSNSNGERSNTTINYFIPSWNVSKPSRLPQSDAPPFVPLSPPHSHNSSPSSSPTRNPER